MSLPQNWLIATNGAKYASEAVRHAAHLYAALTNKPVVSIQVVALSEEEKDQALAIGELAKFLFEDITGLGESSTICISYGDPVDEIIKLSKERSVDQLFLGGGDFKLNVSDPGPGGISNKIIQQFSGVITLVK